MLFLRVRFYTNALCYTIVLFLADTSLDGYSPSDFVHSIDHQTLVKILSKLRRVDTLGILGVRTTGKSTKIIRSKPSFFNDLIFLDLSQQVLGPFVCRETVL